MDNDSDGVFNTPSEYNRTRNSLWKPLLEEPLRSRAQEAILRVAQCMSNPEYVHQHVQQAWKHSPSPLVWDLMHPCIAAELALFYHFIARCFPEQNWYVPAQQYFKLIETGSQQHRLTSPALFAGTSGIAFTIQHFSKQGQRYQQTLARLHSVLAEQVNRRAYYKKPFKGGNAEIDFDIITGASGIVSYLTSIPSPDSTVQEIIHILLRYLCTLIGPSQDLGHEQWFCPPSFIIDRNRQDYPHGRFNCGLAHGIAGPLAALAIASLAHYDAHDLQASITSASKWLIQHQIHDKWGVTWPTVIPYDLASSPEQWHTLAPSRTAWCYGSLGISRALWLAGQALGDEHLAKTALDAFKAVLHRPFSTRHIDAPTLCHGHAGLLLICLRFAHESQDSLILEQIPLIVEYILTHFDPQNPFGFRNIEKDGILVDQPGLLTGASGTVLALLAASSNIAPSWDRLLLIS